MSFQDFQSDSIGKPSLSSVGPIDYGFCIRIPHCSNFHRIFHRNVCKMTVKGREFCKGVRGVIYVSSLFLQIKNKMKKNCSSSHVNELFIFKFFYKVYNSFSEMKSYYTLYLIKKLFSQRGINDLYYNLIRIFLSLLSFHPKFSFSFSHFLSALCALSASLGFLLKHETGWLGLAAWWWLIRWLGLPDLGLGFPISSFSLLVWWWLTAWVSAWRWWSRAGFGVFFSF